MENAKDSIRKSAPRYDEATRTEIHSPLVTEAEFDAVIDGSIDVLVSYDGRRLMMGQSKLGRVAEFIKDLAEGKAVIMDCSL